MESAAAIANRNPNTVVPSLGGGLEGAFFRTFMFDLDDYIRLMTNLQDLATQPYYMVGARVSDVFGLDRGRGLLTSILEPSLRRAFRRWRSVRRATPVPKRPLP